MEHTAEVELAIEAESEREVLYDAMRGLAELLGFGEAGGRESREFTVGADDRGALLAAWLEELVYLAESEGFVATDLERLALEANRVTAVVSGVRGDPPPLVKAVTYHGLTFRRSARGYVASVVLDV